MTGLFILTLACVRFRKRGLSFVLGLILFGLYLLAALDVVFFPVPLPQSGTVSFTWDIFRQNLGKINLIPFKYDWIPLYMIPPDYIYLEVIGNVLLTIPFGAGMSYLARVRGWWVIGLALMTGLALEGTQFIILLIAPRYEHNVDINDVLLNALGVLIGAGLFRAMGWLSRRRYHWTAKTR